MTRGRIQGKKNDGYGGFLFFFCVCFCCFYLSPLFFVGKCVWCRWWGGRMAPHLPFSFSFLCHLRYALFWSPLLPSSPCMKCAGVHSGPGSGQTREKNKITITIIIVVTTEGSGHSELHWRVPHLVFWGAAWRLGNNTRVSEVTATKQERNNNKDKDKMPIPLGAPLSDPKFVFLQILHTLSMFFITLGFVRVVLGVLSLTFIDSSAFSVPLFTSLGYCFHVPLRSLFAVRVEDVSDGSAMRFFLMHFLTACFFSFPLALTIQRRKFVLDFIFTLYAMYYVFCCLANWRLTGGGFAWWLSVLTGFCVLYGLTFVLCGRRELQDIFFPLPTAPAAAVAAVGGSGGVCSVSNSAGGGDGDVMMTTLGTAAEANGVDVDGCSFSNGCSSPRTVTEAVLMGPGSARKRRQ
ncbi:hypothetical protein MOQ_003122 [Trypanosoma cruzi marinkellei]|uniref:Transmembrane protein n=1 Tax=Trypanosoma cruzi marinkellei TaxID=85056 RepID=K2NVP8_TRYCR|nr:hypothetical protein MOQ_003122 [Trypanosoma cruzi marinkellei]